MRQIQVSTVTSKPTANGSLRWTKLARSVSAGVVLLALHPFGALAADAAQVERGAAIYTLRCAGCHGEELRNVSGGWSFDLRRLRPDEHDRFVESVTAGKDNMPSW